MDGAGSISGRRCRVPDPPSDRRCRCRRCGAGLYAIQGALNLALQDPHFDVVPESVSADDFDRYRFDRKQTLLQYKTPQGYARVFIRTAYGVDRQTGTRRMLVTPYLRPTGDSKNWTEAEGWWRDRAFVGPLNSKPLAIQVSFELIEFLAARA